MQRITALVILSTVAMLCLYDIYVLIREGDGGTISVVMIKMYMKRPYLLFMAGFLCGHLFAPVIIHNNK